MSRYKLELTSGQLEYLTRIVGEHCGEFFEDDTEEYKEMIENFYSKLITI